MVINFSDIEKKYIITNKGDWKVDENCPDEIKEKLIRKIELLNSEYRRENDGSNSQGQH